MTPKLSSRACRGLLVGGCGLEEEVGRLLHRSAGPGDAAFLGRGARVALDRGPQAVDGQVGQLLGHPLEPFPELVDVALHAGTLRPCPCCSRTGSRVSATGSWPRCSTGCASRRSRPSRTTRATCAARPSSPPPCSPAQGWSTPRCSRPRGCRPSTPTTCTPARA